MRAGAPQIRTPAQLIFNCITHTTILKSTRALVSPAGNTKKIKRESFQLFSILRHKKKNEISLSLPVASLDTASPERVVNSCVVNLYLRRYHLPQSTLST